MTATRRNSHVLARSHSLYFGFECAAIEFFPRFFAPHHFEFILAPYVPKLLRFVHALQGRLFLRVGGSCFLSISVAVVLLSRNALLTSLNIGRPIIWGVTFLYFCAILHFVESYLIFDSLDKQFLKGVVKFFFAGVAHIL